MVRNSFLFLIVTLIPLYKAEPYLAWIQNDGRESFNPFETLFSKLFSITQNLHTMDDAFDIVTDEGRMQVHDNFGTAANKANEFFEQMISFLSGKNNRHVVEGKLNTEFGKERPTFRKEILTIEQHVCVREKKVAIPRETSESVCTSYKHAVRCLLGDINETLIRLIECCDGYHTTDIKKGCTAYDDSATLDKLLYGKDVCTKGLELKNTKFTTLLIPSNESSCTTESSESRNWDEYILEEPYRTYEMLNSQKLPTRKAGTFVIVSINPDPKQTDDKPLLNCIKIIDEDLTWKNGTIQLLSGPLLPTTTQTLLDIITTDPDFSAFNALLSDDLRERLASNDLISTVFVFSNETFMSLPASLQTRMQRRKHCSRELIKEHVYDDMLCSTLKEAEIKSIAGNKHHFHTQLDINNTQLNYLDNNRLLDTDRVASNGVIHVIENIVLSEKVAVDLSNHLGVPEREFIEVAERHIGYEIEPKAIFVPPGDSFQNLTDEKSFVLNHVAISDSHVTDKLIKTALGSKSLPKTTYTLEELITSKPEFSVFASLLNYSNVDLKNNGPFTVFLPSNDALSNNQIRLLRVNKTLANDFIRRHLFEGFFCSKSLLIKTSDRELPIVLKNFNGEYYDGRRVAKEAKLDGTDLQVTTQWPRETQLATYYGIATVTLGMLHLTISNDKNGGKITIKFFHVETIAYKGSERGEDTHKISTLRRVNDGGVSKQLTAAEKRKRMIEAGTKYAAQNRKIKTDCSTRANFMKLSVKVSITGPFVMLQAATPSSAVKIESCRRPAMRLKLHRDSPRKNEQAVEISNSQQSISEILRPDTNNKKRPYIAKTPLKPINEIFERDDAALTSILNRCPQNSVSGRISIFRGRERPSLFPNGINPLDTAAVKFAKPLPLTTLAARSFSLGSIAPTKADTTSILATSSPAVKMSKRTPAKTVRFDESIDFRSPKVGGFPSSEAKVSNIDKQPPEKTDEMILDLKMKFDEMLDKLRNLPECVFISLEKAVHQISSEKSANVSKTCNKYRGRLDPLQNSTTVLLPESERTENLSSCCLSPLQTTPSPDCIALRTRRKVRSSQMNDQEFTPAVDAFLRKSNNVAYRPRSLIRQDYETSINNQEIRATESDAPRQTFETTTAIS
uniref:FAS1 domain-containing protein n=1 Tax=Setaria digitata TaxID=48799 RepID=A0A915PV74_9BILA